LGSWLSASVPPGTSSSTATSTPVASASLTVEKTQAGKIKVSGTFEK